MKAFFKYLAIQFKMDFRDKGTLLTYYLMPLLFFLVIGPVFASVNPMVKPTLAASMGIFAITMGAVTGAPLPLVRLRESGTLRAFKVNGIPPAAVLAVHALSALIHLLLVCAVIFVVSPLMLHADVPKQPVVFFLILILLIVASTGVGILVGVTARNHAVASVASMLIFFPSAMLSGMMFPANMLPKAFIMLGRVFPATHALQAAVGLAYGQQTDYSPTLALIVLAGTAIVLFALAVWRFNSVRQSEKA